MKRRCRSVPNGFTLINLLVVVCTIVILVSILLPILTHNTTQFLGTNPSSGTAKPRSCQGNLVRIGLAFKLYAQDYKDGNSSLKWLLALQPVNPGGPLRAAIVQEEPTPAPQPTPTPLPGPTPSPAQSAFLEKERLLDEELSQIVGKLQGEEKLSAGEVRRLEARAKAINAEIKSGRARLFPYRPQPPGPAPAPTWVRVMLWDFVQGKMLWQKRFLGSHSDTHPTWSRDGAVLAVLGTHQPPVRSGNAWMELRGGIEFLQGTTGKFLGSTALRRTFHIDENKAVLWLPRRILVMRDSDARERPFLRFFNAMTGKTVARWPLDKSIASLETITTDAIGGLWGFASGASGWRVLASAQLDPTLKLKPAPKS